jgi:hypothetical protein
VSVLRPRNKYRGSIVSPGLWLSLQRTFLQWCSHSVHSDVGSDNQHKRQAFWAGWHRPECNGRREKAEPSIIVIHPIHRTSFRDLTIVLICIIPGVFTATLILYRHVPLHLSNTADRGRGIANVCEEPPAAQAVCGCSIAATWLEARRRCGWWNWGMWLPVADQKKWTAVVYYRVSPIHKPRLEVFWEWWLAGCGVPSRPCEGKTSIPLFPLHRHTESDAIICNSMHVFGFEVQNSELCWTNSRPAEFSYFPYVLMDYALRHLLIQNLLRSTISQAVTLVAFIREVTGSSRD